jgi:hypothetical protein
VRLPTSLPKREPAKTKAELREMLTEAVRNSQAENERLQLLVKKDRRKNQPSQFGPTQKPPRFP